MNDINLERSRPDDNNLEQVIEPLASYICATERPRATLRRALAALLNEVEQTNRIAGARVAAFAARRLAMPA